MVLLKYSLMRWFGCTTYSRVLPDLYSPFSFCSWSWCYLLTSPAGAKLGQFSSRIKMLMPGIYVHAFCDSRLLIAPYLSNWFSPSWYLLLVVLLYRARAELQPSHPFICRWLVLNVFWVFLPKTGIPGHIGAKNKYILEPSTDHTPGALRLASVTSYLFLAWKGQVHLVLSTLSSFQLFLANFSQSEAIH